MIYENEIALQKELFENKSDFLLEKGKASSVNRQSAESWVESSLPKIFSKKILFDRDLKEAIRKMRGCIDVDAVAQELSINPIDADALAKGLREVSGTEKSDGIIRWKNEQNIDSNMYVVSLSRMLSAFGWTVLPVFCGSSQMTDSENGILRYIAYNLEVWCQVEHTDLETIRPWACRQYCEDLIDQLVEKRPGIRHCIIIDGIDSLKKNSGKEGLDFLPSKIGMYFRMFVTEGNKEAVPREELTLETCVLQQDEVEYLNLLTLREEKISSEIDDNTAGKEEIQDGLQYIAGKEEDASICMDLAKLEMKLGSLEYGRLAYGHFTKARKLLESLQKERPGKYETKLIQLGSYLMELFINQYTEEYDYEQVYQWMKSYAELADEVCPENQKVNHLYLQIAQARYLYLKGQTEEADLAYSEAYQMMKAQMEDASHASDSSEGTNPSDLSDRESLLALGVERYERRMRRDTCGQWEADSIFTEVREMLRGQDSYHKNEETILLDCRYRYEEANGWFVEFQREKSMAVKCQHLNNALVALEESQIMLNHLIIETGLERANYLLVKIKARYAYILMHAGMQFVRQPKDGASQALIIGIDILQNTKEEWQMPGSDKLLDRMINMLERL